jgi:hypothetical protein
MTAPQDRRTSLFRDFQEALLFRSGNAELDKLSQHSLLMSVADDEDFISEWHRLIGAEQAVLDLHLGGVGAQGNTTRADKFAYFISNLSSTVQRAAREVTGRKRYPRHLLVEGVQPGSVRVVLRAPVPRLPPTQAVDPLTVASTVDSDALRLVATIMGHASDPAQDSIVTAAIQSLPPTARVPLRTAMDHVQSAGWAIRGSISQRGFGYSDFELTSQGATRLRIELEARFDKTYTEEMYGRISGSKDIEGILWFTPEGGTEFRARAADDARLRRSLVEYQLDHPRVFARFDVVESHAAGNERTSVGTSRVLRTVRLAPLGTQSSIDESD